MLSELDWDAQGVLASMGGQDISIVFDVLWRRLLWEDRKETREKRFIKGNYYRAMPYHFNPQLRDLIIGHNSSADYVQKWIENLTEKYSPLYWGVSHFLKGTEQFGQSVLESLIDKGDDVSLQKAVRLMDKFDRSDTATAMKIVSQTSNPKILSEVSGILFSTGVVSGEYGIARAHEARAENLKKYLNDKNKTVKKFVKDMISSLQKNAAKERQDAEEEKQVRRINFEG